jgi:hypothetical protein
MTFDADSHVEESAQTWKHLDEKFARRRNRRMHVAYSQFLSLDS